MLTQAEKAALEQRSILLRRHILELVRAAKAGHIGGDMSVVELAYAVSDLIKSSGRGDFFKSAGKTRFVFLMVGVAARREA